MSTAGSLVKWGRRLGDSRLTGYVVAVVGTAGAAGLHWALASIFGQDLPPFVTFYPVVILSALLGGAGAGFLAAGLSFGVVDYFFSASFHNFRIPSPVNVAELSLFFVLVNLMTSLAGGALRKAYRRTRQQSRELVRTVALLNTQLIERKAAEEMLRQSEYRFRTLAEVSSQVVWVSTPQGESATDSASWRAFTGRTQEQWTGWNWLEAVHPDERQRVAAHWRTALENLQPYRDEYRLLHVSGLFRHVQARAVPLRGPDGKVAEWIGTLTDITTAKRAEAARNMLAAILAESDDAIIAENFEGMITIWNRGAERLFGYSAKQMLGQNIKLLIPLDRLGDEICVLEDIRRGERVDHYESKRLTRLGRLIDVSITASPIHDSANEVVGVSTIARDISERKAIEEAQARLAAIVESSRDAIFSHSLDGIIQTWNGGAERLFGYRADEVIGKPLTLIVPPERLDEEAQVMALVTGGKAVEHFESVRVAKGGRRLDVLLTVSPVKDRQGRITAASKIVRDIGEILAARHAMTRSKQELEDLVRERTAELREALGELEHMSYSMIHDMRAPLRAMRSFAMLLEEECAGSLQSVGLDYSRRICESAKRLDRLITDALNYNQVVRQFSEPTAVELGKLLRGILETYPNLQSGMADIGIEFKELVVLGNESLLTQCFGNLLGNAAKFVAPAVKPRIRVWAEEKPPRMETPGNRDGDRVRIWVEDNGIGIPRDAQEKIFGMFQRLHRENEYPGTGIGLAIVRKAVERMGGRVALESEPGKGSRFWVELPKADRAANLIAPEAAR